MTDDRMESTPRDEFDNRLAGYLRWEARQVDVAPAISEVAVRIAGGTVRRSWPGNPAIAWAAIAMALVVVGTAVLFSGRPENPVVVAPSSSPGLASELPGPCGTGLVALQAAVGAVPLPAFAADIRVPVGGRLALALEEGPAGGTILVAGPEGLDPRVVATFTGETGSQGRVQVIAWSLDERELLVWSGSHDTLTADRNCGNLWTVATDGSSVTQVTYNGPDMVATVSAFAPVGGALAYVQDGAVHLYLEDGVTRTIRFPGCSPNDPRGLHFGLDASKILLVCDAELVIVDRKTETARLIGLPFVLDARWAADGQSIIAAVDRNQYPNPGPVTILEVDPNDGTSRTRVESDVSSVWATPPMPVLSPDGRWLLVLGNGVDNPLPYAPTYIVDTATGATSLPEYPVLTDVGFMEDAYTRLPAVAWLSGNESVLSVQDGAIYEVDLQSLEREEVGAVPVHDFAWFSPCVEPSCLGGVVPR
jgi:hypothetical protein